IAAILEAPQAFHEYRHDVASCDSSNDSAHGLELSGGQTARTPIVLGSKPRGAQMGHEELAFALDRTLPPFHYDLTRSRHSQLAGRCVLGDGRASRSGC